MNKSPAFLILPLALLAACSNDARPQPDVGHGEGHEDSHEEAPGGPRGGRLLIDGDFGIEVTIFETGAPPEFRLYAYDKGKPLPPDDVQVGVDLTRLGGNVERHQFEPEHEYLRGQSEVYEPHSFVVNVSARYAGKEHDWSYESFEGRTQIPEAAAKSAGVETEVAGPGTIRETLVLHGTVVPDPQRVYHVRARFAGVVKDVRKRLGDTVQAGEVLAVVEANESLQRYNIVAPAAGVVVSRDANPGMLLVDEAILTVADLSTVWVELAAFQHDLGRIVPGQSVVVRDVDGHQLAEGRVDTVAAIGSPASQSMTVRVVLPNVDGRWRPGLFVSGEVNVAETPVPLAVKRTAVQTFRDWTVLFEQVADTYEVRPLTLGRQDDQNVEVLAGLKAGARYVTVNSYLIRADIEKSGASHDH